MLLAAPLVAEAQQAGRGPQVGLLSLAPRDRVGSLFKVMTEELRRRGYTEGQNIFFQERYADGDRSRLSEMAAELVRLPVDVVVANANPNIVAAKEATATIPIIMVYGVDPVGLGFVVSFARPGGNITGLTWDAGPEMIGKNVEFLAAIVPNLTRVPVLWNPTFPGTSPYWTASEGAAKKLGFSLVSVGIQAASELDRAFTVMMQQRPRAAVVFGDPIIFSQVLRIVELFARYQVPAVYPGREFVDAGGLISYGVNVPDMWRRAAAYVDKILKGAKPGDLPIEQPTKFELVINLKTAKALGLTIPQSLLLRADEVIQ
jgi:putative ABC transport system substrate-binding protein